MHERPLPIAVVARVVGQVGRHARQQTHPFQERDALARLLLDFLPMIERLLQFLAIDLDPLSAQQHESIAGLHQLTPFGLSQLLVAQRQFDFEVEHAVRVKLVLPGVTNRHSDARTGTLLPPVGQSHQDAAGFEDRHRFQERYASRGVQAKG